MSVLLHHSKASGSEESQERLRMPDQPPSSCPPVPVLLDGWQHLGRSNLPFNLRVAVPCAQSLSGSALGRSSRCPDLGDLWTSVAAQPLWREPLALPAGNRIHHSFMLHNWGHVWSKLSQNWFMCHDCQVAKSSQSVKAHLVSPTMMFQPLSLPCKIQVLHQQPG